jgi:WD40 repeat protein
MPEGYDVAVAPSALDLVKVIPFPVGDRVLAVSTKGVFVLASDRATRLLPTPEEMKNHFEWLQKAHPMEPLSHTISMAHAAISRDGKWIAAGHQDSRHCVFDGSTLQQIAEIGGMSEYPHFAVFSDDSRIAAFNACHFYSGVTIGVRTQDFHSLHTKPYQEDARIKVLQDGPRVYAAAFRADEFIIGDANGYLRAFDVSGKSRWQHFIGGTVADMDISPDGKVLAVTTYAGFLSIIDLDTGKRDPFTIGTGTHKERRRWLIWKKELKPLMW